MTKVVKLTETGGPENFVIEDQSPADPGPQEIRIRQEAIGLNFVDIYHRVGLYKLPSYPAVLGVEGAGVVEAVGSAVTDLKPGDRVTYAGAPVGAYAATRLLPAERALRLPDSVSAKVAAASMLKSLTAYMLLKEVYPVGDNTTVFVQAAAGGAGSTIVRWAKHFGATVIGAVSSDEKAEIARRHGADHVIVGRNADLGKEVKARTDGRGVDVAYEGLGGDALIKVLDCVRPFGMAVNIGQIVGPVPSTIGADIAAPRAIAFARPSVMFYISDTARYRKAADRVIHHLAAGMAPGEGQEYALADVAQAHRDLEAGRTSGSAILIP
ncbi:quinone oxidoreductase family protein [Rhizobium sp. NRK18]|uniref:quinone oxidoreductase family protein n=1 Tax=Rhizobium sp. NRK18 TaxID=2964667 RepID=UPI0021C3C981|nr:quinone oxidoreductase [Rhizobium sp. NRK18]MCQ2003519.1 quinone oxidoreductase [Rhizobium sp. NRK18]